LSRYIMNMRLKKTKLPFLLLLLFMIPQASIQWGCDSYPSKHKPTPTFSYRFEGVLVKDANTNFTHIIATLTRDDSTLSGAEIRFDGDSLAYSVDSTYYRAVFPAGDYPAGSYDIEIRDSSFFHDTLATDVAAAFAIGTVLPVRGEKTPSESVTLMWSPSLGTDGYIMAAVKCDSIYTQSGYSEYVVPMDTSGTFSNEIFTLPNDEPDTGLYYLYVYSYIGSPDSALSAHILPVPLPGQLTGNISVKDLEGRFGTIVVTAYDSIRVVVQPP
jgi:hypothetical protein